MASMSSSTQSHCSCSALRQTSTPFIPHFQSAASGQVAHIDTQVLPTEGVIIELLHQRAAIGRKINTLVPAVSLPSEVLTIIFEFACWRSDVKFIANLEQEPDNTCAGTPFWIARVCSIWRNIALCSSQLWTNVTIFFEIQRAHEQAAMLQCWLSRSGQRPLNVQIMKRDPWNAPIQSTGVIDVLVPHAHRLHSLNVFLPRIWEPALLRTANCVPQLTRIKLIMAADDDNPFISRVNMFANAPQLREVTLVGYNVADVSLPWAQLECLESRYDYGRQLTETLRRCSRLRCCTVDLSDLTWGISTFPATFTALEAFEIFGNTFNLGPLHQIFRTLALPALRSFVLRFGGEPLQWTPELPRFLWHTRATLETLSLSCVLLQEKEFLRILRALPRLRNLVISNWYKHIQPKALTQNGLNLMNPSNHEGSGCEGIEWLDGEDSEESEDVAEPSEPEEGIDTHCLVPNLETFEYEGEIDFTPHALVELLVARWRGPSTLSELDRPELQTASESALPGLNVPPVRLRSVKFKTPRQIQFDDSDAGVIRQLQLEGMHLIFRGFSKRDG